MTLWAYENEQQEQITKLTVLSSSRRNQVSSTEHFFHSIQQLIKNKQTKKHYSVSALYFDINKASELLLLI